MTDPSALAPTPSADDLRAIVLDVLRGIAPEATSVPDTDDLREALELDSMDFLRFLVGLHEKTGVDIPERDYPQLTTLNGIVAYLARSRV